MSIFKRWFFSWIGCLCLTSNLCAQASSNPQAPDIAAKAFFLLDLSTGQVLAERNADVTNDPASLTKLMTAYVVFQALKDKKISLQQAVPISARAWDERKGDPSLMFVDTTMQPTIDELLKGMIVQSGNDASVALAEATAGSVENFVATMNRLALSFGLKNTEFRNVTGMTQAGHRTTARDIATIASRIIQDFPQYYHYYSITEFTFNKIRQDNRNLLLRRDPTVDGMKTGYTDAAGYCLVTSARREFPNGKRRLVSVVMGTASREARANESQKLLNWGFTAWDAIRLFDADKPIATPAIWKGTSNQVKLGAAAGAMINVARGETQGLQTRIERNEPLVAPLTKGQRVGTIKVSSTRGSPVADIPLVVLESVPETGVLGRAWDTLRLWIQ
jgi:D-alanyl-D-alanine carboxypeptidase (penicillin-binding protein 5/6)